MPDEQFHQSSSDSYGQSDVTLLFYGQEECRPGHSWGPALRDAYILHYIRSGRGVFRSQGGEHALEAGQGFLISPDTLVHYEADASDPWTYAWIGLRGHGVRALLARAGLTPAQPVYTAADRPPFERMYAGLLEARGMPGGDLLAQAAVYRLLAALVAGAPQASARQSAPPRAREAHLSKAAAVIENGYSRKLAAEDIARAVGLDRTYLSSLFKDAYGVPLQTYLLQYRMRRARELLRNPSLSVSDVARSVGYPDPFLFSKMFKRVCGVSPSGYREAPGR
ncbi:AraC family transcriptional regulator [Saccharibacillus sp. CPCC 101409]|uniref:AraC family transcriptional regulator n=1 Tax=Saccharibacillus sp. CPCC 101409 TaxID=3058041 RepID=UPI0026724FCF|nr:AraC family transcriptional regulator [Saccharibacillus sp. CPCC 101409]MDO3411638.1 AraC family transcriptional regulator [Saccharibacillus sp. CPCC 101409]